MSRGYWDAHSDRDFEDPHGLCDEPQDFDDDPDANNNGCTCLDVFGEDPSCPLHGTGSPFADQERDPKLD